MFEELNKQLEDKNSTIIEIGYFDGDKDNLLPSIAFWNEFGTYTAPARPFFRNTINEFLNKWTKHWAKKHNEFAEEIKTDLQDTIRRGEFEPNAPITIYGGWMRNKKSGKLFYVRGKGEGKPPLTNTGKLAESVSIRITKKGAT